MIIKVSQFQAFYYFAGPEFNEGFNLPSNAVAIVARNPLTGVACGYREVLPDTFGGPEAEDDYIDVAVMGDDGADQTAGYMEMGYEPEFYVQLPDGTELFIEIPAMIDLSFVDLALPFVQSWAVTEEESFEEEPFEGIDRESIMFSINNVNYDYYMITGYDIEITPVTSIYED